MTRVMIFGGSHVASLILGSMQLRSNKALPTDLQIDFVSAPGPVLSRLRVVGSKLRLLEKPVTWPTLMFPKETFDGWYDDTNSRMKSMTGPDTSDIDLLSYQKCFFIGGQVLRDWQLVDQSIGANSFSSACLSTVCTDLIVSSVFLKCLIGEGPIDPTVNLSCPFEPVLNELSPLYMDEPVKPGPLLRTADLFRRSATGLGYDILPFPPFLLNSDGNAVSANFKSAQEKDFTHLNTLGGSHLLRSMLATVDGFGEIASDLNVV